MYYTYLIDTLFKCLNYCENYCENIISKKLKHLKAIHTFDISDCNQGTITNRVFKN